MTETMLTYTTLERVSCPSCGIPFAIPEQMRKNKREDGGDYYCPNGHILTFGDTELKQLRRKLAAEQQVVNYERQRRCDEQDAHGRTQRRLSATQGVVTRTKKRVGGGACPCCNRYFKILDRHMRSKHPDYKDAR